MMPINLQLSEEEVIEIRDSRVEAASMQEEAKTATTLSDAYSKTKQTPEQGSGAEFIQQLVNQAENEEPIEE